MDAELERRWQEGRAPFDGVTVRLEEVVPLPMVRDVLLVLVDLLEGQCPEAQLCLLHDWHQHDGVVLPPERVCSWRAVREMLSSDESLYEVRAGDTYVRVGLYPEDRSFYLRFYPEDDWEGGDPPRVEHLGDFDLTCPSPLAEIAMARLAPIGLPGLGCEPAKALFDANWAGEWMTRHGR